jgi:hypothetical protein
VLLISRLGCRWNPGGVLSTSSGIPGSGRWSLSRWRPPPQHMEGRQRVLTNHVLLVKEEGPLGVRSCKELKDIIFYQFGIHKHEIYVYHSRLETFIIIFSERHDRDVVFRAGRVIDGVVELSFSSWDVDALSDGTMIPYHVKLSLEGIPQHAWSQSVAEKILGDEALIHHVEEGTRQWIDQHAF